MILRWCCINFTPIDKRKLCRWPNEWACKEQDASGGNGSDSAWYSEHVKLDGLIIIATNQKNKSKKKNERKERKKNTEKNSNL